MKPGPAGGRKFDYAPVEAIAGPDAVSELARRTGIDRSGLQHAKRTGLTVWMADVVAVRGLNLHPIEVWGDAWLVSA